MSNRFGLFIDQVLGSGQVLILGQVLVKGLECKSSMQLE